MIFQLCFSVLLSIVIVNNVNAQTYSCGGNNLCAGAQTSLDNLGYTDEGGLQCGSALSESDCNTLRGNLNAGGADRSDSSTAPGCVHNSNWVWWQTAGTADCGTGNYACVCAASVATTCATNERVVSNACQACPSLSTNVAGDDVSGADTTCDCDVNTHVSGNICTSCLNGGTRAAGDPIPGPDTSCSTLTGCDLQKWQLQNNQGDTACAR